MVLVLRAVGGRDLEGGYEGPQICTSQWGYDYLCLSRTPSASLSTTSLTLPPTFITQQVQGSFVIWNGGGGTLTGTVSVPAPFSIVSGASFSLAPGQPQEVVVRFSSGTAGSFSKGISISSNGGNATVTATAVAHKVSFSPAPLDFGSGLLVMREQCNNMGVCGLRTKKVGLPIEKALTVKNEGSVSVSLTLSTAAPYKIVSVLPTLSPGQSAQVTLRFDPTESGSFSGNVQVGIQDGQGSITSPPLVGTAHKIEIDPAELDFGLVFIGSSRVRKLTVKNQGVTTVALTVGTSSPYSLESPSSFTLAPSQSQDVVMRFTPPNSNVFSSNIRLTAGSNAIDVPVVGRAMTHEEYIQQAVIAYNAAVQQGGYGAMYVQDGDRGLALAGFPSLSADDVTGFLGMFDQLSSPEGGEIPPEVAQALEILNSISEEQLEEWLWALVLAERAGQFEQEYERLLPLGFDQVVQAFQVITGATPNEIKASLQQFVRELADTGASDLGSASRALLELAGLGASIWDHAYNIAFRHYSPFIPIVIRIGFAMLTADNFNREVYDTARKIEETDGRAAANQFLQDIHDIVAYIDERMAGDPEHAFWVFLMLWDAVSYIKTGRDVAENKALIRVAANALSGEYGWDLVDIRKSISLDHHIDLVLQKRGFEVGDRSVNALALINFYECRGRCDQIVERIMGELSAIMTRLDSLLRGYGAEFGLVGLVIVGTGFLGESELYGLFADILAQVQEYERRYGNNVAVFVVWTAGGQIWFACFGSACGEMTDSQKRRFACMLAGRRHCSAEEVVYIPPVITEPYPPPPPPPPQDQDPIIIGGG